MSGASVCHEIKNSCTIYRKIKPSGHFKDLHEHCGELKFLTHFDVNLTSFPGGVDLGN